MTWTKQSNSSAFPLRLPTKGLRNRARVQNEPVVDLERCPHGATTACEWWDVACHKRAQSHAWTAQPSSAPKSRSSPWEKVSFVSVRSYTPPFNTTARWCCIDLLNAPDLSGLGNVFAHRYRLDSDITRQADPDYLAIIFPGQFQSPMVIVAVRVFPIERRRPTGNFDVVNWEDLGKSRIGYNIDRA